jgi:diacylglycerol kinase (ATP)
MEQQSIIQQMREVPTLPPRATLPDEHRPSPVSPQHRSIDWRTSKLIASFGYAFAGLWYMLRTQRNAQIHCLVAACALALGAFLGLARMEWLALILVITLVLAAEGINTAIEATVDVATSTFNPLARIAKDVAAGTVLLCAIAAVIVGCIIFLPHLLTLFHTLAVFQPS